MRAYPDRKCILFVSKVFQEEREQGWSRNGCEVRAYASP